MAARPKWQRLKKRKRALECTLVTSLFAYMTSLQEKRCRSLIAATSISYGVFYVALRLASQRIGSSRSTSLSRTKVQTFDAAEGRSRILSTLNAILLSVGSILCFQEWPYQPSVEGWNGSEWSYPAIFASLFVAFLQWDFLWILYHRHGCGEDETPYQDVSSAIHHVLFIFMTHYVLSGVYFKKAFAWLSFTELSTPFLNARWYFASSGQKDSVGYLYSSFAFAATFFMTRVVGYTLGLIDVWISYPEWSSVNGLHAVAVGLVLGYLLNLFWALKIGKAVRRVILKSRNNDNSTMQTSSMKKKA